MGKDSIPPPEKIVFINGVTNEVTHEVPFSEVPESIRMLPDKSGVLQPVFKIVEITQGNKRTIRQMGLGDIVLKSTLQIREG